MRLLEKSVGRLLLLKRSARPTVAVRGFLQGFSSSFASLSTLSLFSPFPLSFPLSLLLSLPISESLSLSPPSSENGRLLRSFVRRSFFLLQFAQEEEEEVTDGAIGAKESRLSFGGGRGEAKEGGPRLTHAAVCGVEATTSRLVPSVSARCESDGRTDKSFLCLTQLIGPSFGMRLIPR